MTLGELHFDDRDVQKLVEENNRALTPINSNNNIIIFSKLF